MGSHRVPGGHMPSQATEVSSEVIDDIEVSSRVTDPFVSVVVDIGPVSPGPTSPSVDGSTEVCPVSAEMVPPGALHNTPSQARPTSQPPLGRHGQSSVPARHSGSMQKPASHT